MKSRTITFDLADEAATARLGEDIAAALKAGDLVTLSGDLGAGKTTLARAMIRALAADPALEVPSPTYTLVQSYEAPVPVSHFDFYRLAGPDEIRDLDLEGALDEGVALVEWPENAAGALPVPSFAVALAENAGGARTAAVATTQDAGARFSRSREVRSFLESCGWGKASRNRLAGDASTRAYETVTLAGFKPRLVMNAPAQPDGPPIRDGRPYSRIAKLSESVTPFVAIDHCLRERGFSAPEIHAADLDRGLLLIENLGSEGVIDGQRRPIHDRYEAAVDLLADMHRLDWPSHIDAPFGARHDIPAYDREAMLIEVALLLDWYVPAMTGKPVSETDRQAFDQAWNTVIDSLADTESSLVLRDFHSPNLIWRGDRKAHDRLGLIDFQDALIGPSAYDLASLAQDARVSVPRTLEEHLVERYRVRRAAAGGFARQPFDKAYAVMACQRCSKILGIFVRLDRRDGKPVYLQHLPRMRDYLARSIGHEALSPVRELYERWRLMDGETV